MYPIVDILHSMSQTTMTAEQLQQLLANMQAQIDQLEQDLKTGKAVSEPLRQ